MPRAASSSSEKPITVKSNCRSETKIAAGRQGTRGAGTTAIVRQAIAQDSASRISREIVLVEPSARTIVGARKPAAAGVGSGTVTAGRDAGFGFATALRFTFFFGFACFRTGAFLTTRFVTWTTAGVCDWAAGDSTEPAALASESAAVAESV